MAKHPKQLFLRIHSPSDVNMSFSLHSLEGSSSSVHGPKEATSCSPYLCSPGHVQLPAAQQPASHPAASPTAWHSTAWGALRTEPKGTGCHPAALDMLLPPPKPRLARKT